MVRKKLKKVLHNIVVVGFITFFVKCFGAFKEIVTASSFGTGDVLDAFLIAFLVPSFVINVLAGTFQTAIIPTYIDFLENRGENDANKLISTSLLFCFLLLLAVSLILGIFASSFLSIVGPGLKNTNFILGTNLFRLVSPVIIFFGLRHFFEAIMNAKGYFAITSIVPVATPITVVFSLLLRADSWGIYALVFGVVLGSLLELIIVVLVAMIKKIPIFPKWHGISPEMHKIFNQYIPMVMGACLMSGTGLVDQSMASLLGPGSVSILSYANKVTAMVLSVGAMGLGTVVLPYFSRLVANGGWGELQQNLIKSIWIIIGVTIPLTALFCFFSSSIIGFLFERGAFSAQDTLIVSKVQMYYFLQLPSYTLGILGSRLISSMGRNDILMKISCLSLLLNILFNYLFMNWFGVSGIAMSTSFVYLFSTMAILGFLYGKIRLFNAQEIEKGLIP